MSIIKILNYPDPRLKSVGEDVVDVHAPEIQKIIDDMFETHYNAENCAALAATQLDFIKPKKITVIDYSANKDEPLCLINPEIIATDGEQNETEGCMSVYPSLVHARVKRAMWVKVRALDREGKPIEFEAEGYRAKCIQHEIDHLNGLLYLDRLPKVMRRLVEEKIRKVIQKLRKKNR